MKDVTSVVLQEGPNLLSGSIVSKRSTESLYFTSITTWVVEDKTRQLGGYLLNPVTRGRFLSNRNYIKTCR